jgi:hypothetical protein
LQKKKKKKKKKTKKKKERKKEEEEEEEEKRKKEKLFTTKPLRLEGVHTMLSITPGKGFIEYKRVRKEFSNSIFQS